MFLKFSFFVVSFAVLHFHSMKCVNIQTFSGFLSYLETIYDFHSIIFIIPNTNFIESMKLHQLKTPTLFITDNMTKKPRRIPSMDSLFVVIRQNNILMSEKNITKYAKQMGNPAKVVVLDFDAIDNEGFKGLKPAFEWLFRSGMLAGIVLKQTASGNLKIYAYEAFPEIQIFEVQYGSNPFRTHFLDMKGYPIRSFAVLDPPRAFKYQNRDGEEVYAGFGARTVLAFLKKHNGTLVEIDYNSTYLDGFELHYMIMEDKIDMSMHVYPNLFSSEVAASYPLTVYDLGVIVPAPQELDPALYNMLPFENLVWLILFCFIFYFSAIDLVVILILRDDVSYVRAIATGAGVLIGLLPGMSVYNSKWQARIICLIFAFFGIIVTSLYQSSLTSFYTTKVYGERFETIDDVIARNLTILVFEDEWTLIETALEPKSFRKQFLPVSKQVYTDHKNAFDSTFGYMMTEDTAIHWLNLQTHLDRPRFDSHKFAFVAIRFHILLKYLSPFIEELNRVVLQCHQGGLIMKWLKDSLDESVEAGLIKRYIASDEKYKPLVLSNFKYFLMFFCCGMTVSFVCFFIEIILHRIKQRNKSALLDSQL